MKLKFDNKFYTTYKHDLCIYEGIYSRAKYILVNLDNKEYAISLTHYTITECYHCTVINNAALPIIKKFDCFGEFAKYIKRFL